MAKKLKDIIMTSNVKRKFISEQLENKKKDTNESKYAYFKI